jgi:hypothetical protein
MVMLSDFLLPPPVWNYKIWYRFAGFFVSALVGLLFIPTSRFSRREHTVPWLCVTLLALGLGVVFFFEYQSLGAAWTRAYAANRVVIGQTLTQSAADYKLRLLNEDGREVSDEELIMDSAGDIGSIWDPNEIRHHSIILAGVYLCNISLLATSVITLVQTQYCASRRSAAKKSARVRVAENL